MKSFGKPWPPTSPHNSIGMNVIDFFLHLDHHLEALVTEYQTTSYLILCLIIFCETGLVVTPLLPGDSLLFAAGAIIAKIGVLNVWVLIPLLFLSAILGDHVNYFIGSRLGPAILTQDKTRFFKKKYLIKTQAYYEKHGGKTIIMARFVPIVRTFAPFVAGVGSMKYSRFVLFCVVGGALWVSLLTLAGYYFGSMPIIRNNFEMVVFGIIGISLLPVLFGILKQRFGKA
jgi:membrane-associated protein